MTLSHRWHEDTLLAKVKLFTILATGPTLKISLLPQAFQDAIYVTRSFSINWLWIDCLCILQSSADDFLAESSVMHKIYGNSYCNISATGASSNLQSLFSPRDQDARPAPVANVCSWGSSRRKRLVLTRNIWQGCIDDAPVNRRAWVVQERYLSPRVLHFAKGQLFWECQELRACELYPGGFPASQDHRGHSHPFKHNILDPRRVLPDHERHSEAGKVWSQIVEKYSRSGLSKDTDKLVALSGLASRFHEVFGDTYLAGLWRSRLLQDLLWCAIFPHKASRYDDYVAPTWSWASLNGESRCCRDYESPDEAVCTILSAFVTLKTSSPFGEVAYGELQIFCRLIRLQLDYGTFADTTNHSMMRVDGRSKHHMFHDIDESGSLTTRECWGAFLGACGIGVNPRGPGKPMYVGLLLRTIDCRQGVFARIGLFRIRKEDGVLEVLSYHPPDANTYPCNHYDPDNGMYTITII